MEGDNNGQQPQVDIAKKHRLQMDLMMKESDFKRNFQEKAQKDVEMRQARRKMDLLNIDMQQYKNEIEKIDAAQIGLALEIKKLKKTIADM